MSLAGMKRRHALMSLHPSRSKDAARLLKRIEKKENPPTEEIAPSRVTKKSK